MTPTTIEIAIKVANTLVMVLLAYGLCVRDRPRRHVPAMLIAFVADVILVLVVEVHARASTGRGAVEQAGEAALGGGTIIQYVHIPASLVCILCYIVAVVTGRRLFRTGQGRRAHRANAVVFLLSRVVSYGTSFWM